MVVIAVDVQGAEVAKPWVEKAGGTYRALLDRHNAIGKAFGVKFVPVGILVDEAGRLVKGIASVDIGKAEFRDALEKWARMGAVPEAWRQAVAPPANALTPEEREADARFQLAVVLLDAGKRLEALAELKRAFRLDPANWLIRKQLWAIETPEAFYTGDVDYGWQKARIERERAELEAEKP